VILLSVSFSVLFSVFSVFSVFQLRCSQSLSHSTHQHSQFFPLRSSSFQFFHMHRWSLMNEFSWVVDLLCFDLIHGFLALPKEKAGSVAIAQTSIGKEIELRLLPIKLFFLICCALIGAKAWTHAWHNDIFLCTSLTILAIDSYILAYNCSGKRYFMLACRSLGGTLRKGRAAIHRTKQRHPGGDTLLQLREGIVWTVLPRSSLIGFLVSPLWSPATD
jgi:hypothetical protein